MYLHVDLSFRRATWFSRLPLLFQWARSSLAPAPATSCTFNSSFVIAFCMDSRTGRRQDFNTFHSLTLRHLVEHHGIMSPIIFARGIHVLNKPND